MDVNKSGVVGDMKVNVSHVVLECSTHDCAGEEHRFLENVHFELLR
jgi:hypothetical protein